MIMIMIMIIIIIIIQDFIHNKPWRVRNKK